MKHKVFKPIALVVLFFFCWSFGGIFDVVAFAATDSKQTPSNKQLSNQSSTQGQSNTPKPEEKFQKTIEDIENVIKEVEKLGRLEDEKWQKLKTKKTELETLDIEIKKQFNDTEKFLKEKGLPPEILDRH